MMFKSNIAKTSAGYVGQVSKNGSVVFETAAGKDPFGVSRQVSEYIMSASPVNGAPRAGRAIQTPTTQQTTVRTCCGK